MSAPSAAALKALTDKGALAATLAQKLNAVRVDFSLAGDKITDHEVALVSGVSGQIVWLNVARTKVTDAGLAPVAKLSNLTRIHLENTGITDAGLKHLSGLSHLTYVNLYGTTVTDAGLKNLEGLKNLKSLYLWQTKVTQAGADALKKALPDCEINIGAALSAAAAKAATAEPAAAAAAAPANKTCPVSGKPVDAAQTSVFTKEVAFCCTKCKGKFDKNPAACIGKVDLADAKLNTTCPVSNKPAKADVKSTYTTTVGFCCGKCKGKFDAAPASFIAKVK